MSEDTFWFWLGVITVAVIMLFGLWLVVDCWSTPIASAPARCLMLGGR